MSALWRVWIVGVLAVAAATAGVIAGSARAEEPLKGARACFERLKQLQGEWIGPGLDGNETTVLRFRVTAGGSAVEEIEFPGSGHEMITVHYMDGDSLMLTHYCSLGNQPRMRAKPESTPERIVYECDSVGNVKSHDEPHMHSAVFTFPEKDRLEAAWTMSENGKPGFVARIPARRK